MAPLYWPTCLRAPARAQTEASMRTTAATEDLPDKRVVVSAGRTSQAVRITKPPMARGVASDFGAPHGTPIANAATALHDLYRALGHDRPPAIVGVFVEPYHDIVHTDAAGVGINPFGHAAMGYTRNGSTQLMNISGSKTTPMVNFMRLEDYLFGVDTFDTGNEQGGIYNRTFRLICVWDWPSEQVEALHAYYTRLDALARAKRARFAQIFPRLLNCLPRKTRWGNCSMWTAQGLVEAGMLERNTMWPKEMIVQMLERLHREDPSNITAVWLPRVTHAKLTFGRGAGQRGIVAPCYTYHNCMYWDLGARAQATLTVPPGTMVARPYVL